MASQPKKVSATGSSSKPVVSLNDALASSDGETNESIISLDQEEERSIVVSPPSLQKTNSKLNETDISSSELSELKNSLSKAFSLGELRDLAFDLGIDFEDIPHHETKKEFARELVRHCERRGRVGELTQKSIEQRGNLQEVLGPLLAKCPVTNYEKAQLIFPASKSVDIYRLRMILSDLLGIPPEQIDLVAASYGSIRLLISLPPGYAERLADILNSHPEDLQKYGIGIKLFSELEEDDQSRWRTIATNFVPDKEETQVFPTTDWEN